jgi:squalene-hopene/tetraprenyl-beta-curcumene cyclase
MNRLLTIALTAATIAAASVNFAQAEGAGDAATTSATQQDWNRFAAAKYLDTRQTWWMNWPKAQRDHETACISCHTAVPYAMSRLTLRHDMKETTPSAPEQQMLGYVTKRVNLWDELEPFYSDEKVGPRKTVESRGTESVLNALILTRYDSMSGEQLSPLTEKAFKNMWAKQLTTGDTAGSWEWLNFHNAPWESDESHYYGSALAAVAVSIAPGHYESRDEIQPGVARLKAYLRSNYATQPMANKLVVLWASAKMPGLLTKDEHKALIEDVKKLQREDGGWCLADFGKWTERRDKTSFEMRSDGYATGLAVFALGQAGESQKKTEMKRGIAWLLVNQDAQQGQWHAYSLNKQRDPTSDVGRFMSDAATSYAVMALESVGR